MEKVVAVIDRNALRYNLKKIKKIAIHSKIVAIVKANAYGHGLIKTADSIKDLVDYFGVARINEAIKLRKNKIFQPILLLNSFINQKELILISKYNIDTTIQSKEQIKIIKKTKLTNPIKIWIKIDTGMHRLGIRKKEIEKIYNKLLKFKIIKKPINIISHFSHANENKSKEKTKKQLNLFKKFTKNKNGKKSIAASSGILFWPSSHFDYVRPGIIMYGISPNKNQLEKNFGLKPVMTLKSNLIAIYQHQAGDPVGYNGAWISKKNTHIGIISIGYGDGYPSNVPSGTPVFINKKLFPIIGKISMDTTIVDLGKKNKNKIGQEVIMWGKELPIEKIASYAKISNYALISNLTSRVKMKYIK